MVKAVHSNFFPSNALPKGSVGSNPAAVVLEKAGKEGEREREREEGEGEREREREREKGIWKND